MIPFTFSQKIEFIITDSMVENATNSVVNEITNQIEAEKPSKLTINQLQISFSGGSFRRNVPNIRLNILSQIHHGIIQVTVSKNKLIVSYKLWYTEMFIIVTVVSILFALLLIISSGFIIQNLWVALIIWAFLYLGNYVISVIRFNIFIHFAINKLDFITDNEYKIFQENE